MVDMANAMGVEAVITTFAVGDVQDQTGKGTRPITPGDMADLVEYSFGGADTTWGKKRIEEDHHPEIYNWSYIELGNEQYNPTFVEQVAAMEKRAAEVGVAGKLHYLFPSGWNAKPQGVNATDAPKAAALKLGDRLLCDLHVTVWGHDGPVEPQLDGDGSISAVGGVARFQNVLTSPTTGPQGWGAMNLETNCGDHTFRRALEEAFDLNTYANEGNPRLKGRGASFCMERSGYQEAGLNDQGLIFFLPNVRSLFCMFISHIFFCLKWTLYILSVLSVTLYAKTQVTWGQPPYYVHAMIANTSQPNACQVTMKSSDNSAVNPKGVVSAQVSDGGRDIVVRYVNIRPHAIKLEVEVKGISQVAATIWLLHTAQLSDSNTPSNPTFVAPSMTRVDDISKGIYVPGNSFVIAELAGH